MKANDEKNGNKQNKEVDENGTGLESDDKFHIPETGNFAIFVPKKLSYTLYSISKKPSGQKQQ